MELGELGRSLMSFPFTDSKVAVTLKILAATKVKSVQLCSLAARNFLIP